MQITQKLSISTISIGTGVHCNGHVLFTSGGLGLTQKTPTICQSLHIFA